MASTFTQLYVHYVFSTKDRAPLIPPEIEPALYAFLVGISKSLDCWVMAINGTCDHVHLLVSMSKHQTVIAYMEEIKRGTSRWMHQQGDLHQSFRWQDGYAALSVGPSGLPKVRRYIQNQKEHHRTMSFQDELLALLKHYGIPYDERYIWR